MVPHLLRIRSRQNPRRRSRVAQLHRHGRVLPERPTSHLDRLVPPASPPLVPRLHHLRHPSPGTSPGLDAISPAPLAHRLLPHSHTLGVSSNPDRKLHLPELSSPLPRHPLIRRSFPKPIPPATLEEIFPSRSANNQRRRHRSAK